jgi:hypothetical protein
LRLIEARERARVQRGAARPALKSCPRGCSLKALVLKKTKFDPGGDTLMPEVGDVAPDFELPSHLEKGKKVKLSDFRGKSNVVIAFYPLAWTPV